MYSAQLPLNIFIVLFKTPNLILEVVFLFHKFKNNAGFFHFSLFSDKSSYSVEEVTKKAIIKTFFKNYNYK